MIKKGDILIPIKLTNTYGAPALERRIYISNNNCSQTGNFELYDGWHYMERDFLNLGQDISILNERIKKYINVAFDGIIQ